MALFILGPSEWKTPRTGATPYSVRKHLAEICRTHGHTPILMEEVADLPTEGLTEKFLRILARCDIQIVIVLWPREAKMPTTIAELVALRFRRATQKVPVVWVLLERGVADLSRGEFHVNVAEGQVGYLKDLTREGTELVEWRDLDDLFHKMALLAASDFMP